MQFSDADITLIITSLRVAAEVYANDARVAREAGEQRVAEQFGRQAAGSRALADHIEATH